MKTVVVLLACCVLGALGWFLSSAQSHRKSQQPEQAPLATREYFDLAATPGSVPGYMSRIVEARFIMPNGGSFPVPFGHHLDHGWGGTGIHWVIGDGIHQAPETLEIRWYSFNSDTFFEGRFSLPRDRILAMLRRGRWDESARKQYTYAQFDVTVMPTGGVVVWLGNGLWEKEFIGRYQAKEFDGNYAAYFPRTDRKAVIREIRDKAPPEVRKQMDTGTVNTEKYDDYLKKYHWRLAIDRPARLVDYNMMFFNAEAVRNPVSPDMTEYANYLLEPVAKAVPKSMRLYFTLQDGRERSFWIDKIDEKQTIAAFRKLHAAHPDDVITLTLATPEDSYSRLVLQSGGETIKLNQTAVDVYQLGPHSLKAPMP